MTRDTVSDRAESASAPDHPDSDAPTAEGVREALQSVSDPDLGTDVVSSGVVEEVGVNDGTVTVDASFAGLPPERVDELTEAMRQSVFELPGVEHVRVTSDGPHADHPHGDGRSGDDSASVGDVDRILAVASAKGGVGKTTVATQLARGLDARGESVGLFDADVYGPNVPDVLGVSGPLESTDDGAAKPVDADGVQVVSVGCIANDEPLAWRGAMAHEAVLELLTDAAWDGVDTLVLDLPPGTGDVVLTALQSIPVDGVVLVTTPFPTAAGDTARSATLFREQGVPVLGAVVNMAGYTCPTCGDEHAPFGAETDLETDVLAELPIDEGLRDATDAVPDDFVALADRVDSELADAGGFDVPDHALDLRGVPERARVEQLADEFVAAAPGEPLFAVTDRPPRRLGGALTARTDCDGDVDIETTRTGPESWALKVERTENESCHCRTPEPGHTG